MTDRERLIELKINFVENFYCGDCKPSNDKCRKCLSEKEADYLLEHGVIVPPCKVGDTVYFIYEDMICEGIVKSIESRDYVLAYVSSKRTEFAIPKSIFGESAFLTIEEAEQSLKRSENNASL